MIKKKRQQQSESNKIVNNNKISENSTISHISQSLQTTIMQKVDNNEQITSIQAKPIGKNVFLAKTNEKNRKLNK